MILKTLLRWCLTLALPIVFATVLLSGDIMSLWGPEFVTGSTALSVLAVSQLVFVASNLLGFTLLMCGKQYLELGNVVFITILNIVMNLLLIPRFGITGAAIAMLSSQLVAILLRLVAVRSILGIDLYTSKYLKPLMALLPVSAVIYVFQESLVIIANVIFRGFSVGVLTMMFMLICTGYFMGLYFLGIENEDSAVFKELRIAGAIQFFTKLEDSRR